MDRRQFLSRSAFFTVAAASLTACGGGGGSEGAGTYKFPQGVASGDPRESSLVFWSRCVRATGVSGDISVRLQVSTTAQFFNLLADLPLVASAAYDNTVRAKVTGLPAATPLYYRFLAGNDVSAVGVGKTAPASTATLAQLRFAWFTCQDWSVNHWAAMNLLVAEDLDFVVHLGDYIYETVGAAFQSGAAEPAHARISLPDGTKLSDGTVYATTLADYRTLYKTYRGDARLQAIHAKFPMIATWDDHEFSDDCWQDHQTYTNANLQQTARRRAANQAWVEYMPVDFGDVSFDSANAAFNNLRIYRDFRFGTLMHLVMTDERLYRDDHVVNEATIASAQGHDPINGSDSIGARYFVQVPVLQQFEALKTQALGRVPSILGTTQTAWWKQTLSNSTATWKVWGNEVMLSRLWLDLRASAPAPYNAQYVVNCDGWDGYPSHKADLLGHITSNNIQNVVAITGDLHAFQCGVVRDKPDTSTGTPAVVDFVSAGISSSSFYSYVKAGAGSTPLAALVTSPATFDAVLKGNNPDFAYVDHDAQGYASATLTASSLQVVYTKMKPLTSTGTVPDSPVLKRTRITLAAGSKTPVVTDNV
ncbi:MAG: alkaline phosphatase D family protein [Curvibacter lanceolatus]|uniref:alkaline phosphatase D family protein n=1 Tax=Curvibacter lanceolatus TaxID=86182 RepID=UPI002352AD4D|nr:alkaline phosphatase D family protein [Curvibacter lanceolatus]MBV5292259.1 alkaline phosphatase D family protein [Curvibacter lanceolatus]